MIMLNKLEQLELIQTIHSKWIWSQPFIFLSKQLGWTNQLYF